jgi:hypothetical protein
MMVIRPSALAVLVAAIAATMAVPVQAATPQVRAVAASSSARTVAASALTVQQYGCSPNVGAIEPGGTLNHVILNSSKLTGPFFRDYLSTLPGVTALGSTSYEMVDSNKTWYFRTFTVRGGALKFETKIYPNSNPAAARWTSRSIARGWGSVVKIVDASERGLKYTKGGYLYGLNVKAGTLARYKVTEATFGAPTVRFNAARIGFGNFRSLALAYRYREGYAGAADVLIGTTTWGGLYLITIPVAGAFSPRFTQLRPSAWKFDDLVVGTCNNKLSLIAVRSDVDRAFLYRLDTIAGRSSVIRSYGALAAPWTPAHSSGIWAQGVYPKRW